MATQQTNDTGEQRTKLVLDITPALRKRIERAAARGDLSAAEYAARLLERTVPEEEEEQQHNEPQTQGRRLTPEDVDLLMQTRDAISHGRVFEDSVELIRQMREERTEHLMRVIEGK